MIEIPCQFVAVGDEELPFVQCNIHPPAVGALVFVAGKPEAWEVVSVQLQWADSPSLGYPLPQMWIVALEQARQPVFDPPAPERKGL
jgi:hypothetical protein